MTRDYDGLKDRTGSIVAAKKSGMDLNVYRVSLDSHLIPILFSEEELQFLDSSKERDWKKLKQILNNKFSKGDLVIILGYNSQKYSGKVIESEFGQKEPIYIVEVYGGELRFSESSLIHQNPEDERDWKLKQLLKQKES